MWFRGVLVIDDKGIENVLKTRIGINDLEEETKSKGGDVVIELTNVYISLVRKEAEFITKWCYVMHGANSESKTAPIKLIKINWNTLTYRGRNHVSPI